MKPERVLPVKNAINLREMGGLPTTDGQYLAWHKLLRSGSLGHLTAAAGADLVDYGLSFDVDLRSESEVQARPDQLPRSVSYQHLAVYPFTDQHGFFDKIGRRLKKIVKQNAASMADVYLRMMTDSHASAAYADLIQILLAHDAPNQAVLFHCTAGKDRTGIGAMIIEGALGVPEDQIRADYLLTDIVLADPSKAANAELMHGASQFVNQMNAQGAESGNYDAVHQLIETEFGSWRNYFQQQLGFSTQDLTDLRRLYLQDSPDPKE